ncbi:MAG TPA: tetratricopeptide repeat protein [Pyrinomonadaceae bacterium]
MTNERRNTPDATHALPTPARLLIAAVALCLASWLAWASLRAGVSRFAAEHALRTRAPAEAELAARLAPSDPDAHFALAWLRSNAGDAEGARRAYERALELRPRDHVLWLELGQLLERGGDTEGALGALGRAAELAPHYAQPRWHLGHALLRAGRTEAAFAELRRAAEADPSLYPNLLQAVWHASGKDAAALVRVADPRTTGETLAVVSFLVKAGTAADGLRLLRERGAALTPEARRALVADLIAVEEFGAAYEVWAEGRGASGAAFADGGFEAAARTDAEDFGWRFARDTQTLRFSLDSDAPREGARSLKVEYAGASEPSAHAVSQLLAVEPGARYRLTFSARSSELVTGGPPFVEVVSASKTGGALAAAPPLPRATDGWRDFSLEFNAPPSGAVRVLLRRAPCASAPCPAFGSLWLDAFELRRLS